MADAEHTNQDQQPEIDFHWPMVFPDDELLGQIDSAQAKEARLDSRLERISRHLGTIAVSEAIRAINTYNTSDTIGKRAITDPHKRDPEIPRAPETIRSRRTLGRLTMHFANRYSLNGPNGDKIRRETREAPDHLPESPRELSRTDRRHDLKTAKRLKHQELRQDRSRHAEAVFGGGIGLGQEARARTRLARRRLRHEAKEAYLSGDITAEGLVERENSIMLHRVTVPTKAVSKNVRRERAGAIHAHLRANQSVKKHVRTIKKRILEIPHRRTKFKLDQVRIRRQELEDEAKRRIGRT